MPLSRNRVPMRSSDRSCDRFDDQSSDRSSDRLSNRKSVDCRSVQVVSCCKVIDSLELSLKRTIERWTTRSSKRVLGRSSDRSCGRFIDQSIARSIDWWGPIERSRIDRLQSSGDCKLLLGNRLARAVLQTDDRTIDATFAQSSSHAIERSVMRPI